MAVGFFPGQAARFCAAVFEDMFAYYTYMFINIHVYMIYKYSRLYAKYAPACFLDGNAASQDFFRRDERNLRARSALSQLLAIGLWCVSAGFQYPRQMKKPQLPSASFYKLPPLLWVSF